MSYDLLMAHFKTPASLAASLLAHGVTISPQAIYKWQKQGVPLERAPLIERASQGQLRCEQMCPAVEWIRDKRGVVTGYQVRVSPFRKPRKKAA